MTTVALNPPRSGGMTSEERLVIFASSLGTVFEWYDFYIYGTLGVFLAKMKRPVEHSRRSSRCSPSPRASRSAPSGR
jgi:hypothetical protein